MSPTSVKIGFLLLSLGNLGDVGVNVPGVDAEQQRDAFEGYVAEINAAGGIHGRRVIGEYRIYDPLNEDSQRAACLALVRDAKVFAVVAPGGFTGPAQLCVTEEHGVPLVSAEPSVPSSFFARSRGLLFTMFPAGSRMMADWASELARLGALKGKKVGVLGDDGTDPGGQTLDALVAALSARGNEPAHRSRLSEDLNTGASQIPVEVQQMRSKGVDAVLIATNTLYATQFVQNADSQRWTPKWFVSDWSGGTNDPFGQRMPASFDGSIGISTKRTQSEWRDDRRPPATPERECREVYERRTTRRLERGSNEDGLTLQNCALVRVLVAGAIGAGPELTRQRLSSAIQALGPVDVPVWGGGSFSARKFDFADLVRPVQFRRSCRCWMPAGDFRPTTR